MKKQAMRKNNKMLKTAWALVETERKLIDARGYSCWVDVEPLATIAHNAGLAVVQSHKSDEYDFTFDDGCGVYQQEIRTGDYYFIPQEAWNAAYEADCASGWANECSHRRAAIMQYATPATFDAWREAWS